MTVPLGALNPEQFLKEFWQKKPCLIRQAFPDFSALIGGDDLAGLACEEMAEARLIKGNFADQNWEVSHGPFDAADFSTLPDDDWTLLVQDVEKHYAPLQALMQQFSFIPGWRLDDLMISYAVQGGSVGPHVDQYDVFLLQAEGKRRWQIAESFEPHLLTDCPLNVLRAFQAEQDWVLEPGDMLYLPPNVAHHGVALDAGMTWSIGSRAPSAADLLQGLGEWLAFSTDEGGRYADRNLNPGGRVGEINSKALKDLRQLMLSSISENPDLDHYLAHFMSRFRLAHEPVSPPETTTTAMVLKSLSMGHRFSRNPWTRLTWIDTGNGARLFAAGQSYDCSIWLAESLCAWKQPPITASMLDQTSLLTLTSLINNGHFLLTSGDD